LLDLPLLVTEEETYAAAKKYYPKLRVKKIEFQDLSLEYLATNFDVIFESTTDWAAQLLPLLEMFFNKPMRMIYCPHGNSDKNRSTPNDISLYYGPQMRRHLDTTGAKANAYIRSGNYRYHYYLENKTLYDNFLDQELKNRLDPTKKTVFFAPTWPDSEVRSSFPMAGRVFDEVSQYYNILVRLHPFIAELYPVKTEEIRRTHKNVIFLDHFPCIYPILNRADFYLGDHSSIGYDFLAFDKPLFFLEKQFGSLKTCGVELSLADQLGQSISQSPEFREERQRVYKDVFGEKREMGILMKEIQEALSLERASWENA
jgi:hypothetical protein